MTYTFVLKRIVFLLRTTSFILKVFSLAVKRYILLSLEASSRFELYLPTDMRKSFDSLCGIVQSELSNVPTDGCVYIFLNKLHNNRVSVCVVFRA